MDLTLSGNVNFLPPGGTSNTNVALAVAATYGAQALATIDVPSGTASGTSFTIGFGSVAAPVGFYVKNTMPSGGTIGLCLNNTVIPTGMVSLMPGAVHATIQPNGAGVAVAPLTAARVYVLTTTTYQGTIEVAVFGD
jgi:hypothetical protein